MSSNVAVQRPRVVIIGAGFGGLSAAKSLAKAPFDVALIDRFNYHMFQPLLTRLRPRHYPRPISHFQSGPCFTASQM